MARELAARRSTTVTDAVRQALRAELERSGPDPAEQEASARKEALLAILQVEPEALAFVDCLRQLGEAGQAELDLRLGRGGITPVPLQDLHVHWGLDAPLLFEGDDFAATDFAATDVLAALPS